MQNYTRFALVILCQCILIPLFGQLSFTTCESDPLAGNTVSVFDWRSEYYTFYMQGLNNSVQVASPFWIGSPFQENVSHLSSAGAQDFDPEDGWELVFVDFGSESRKVETPILVLYNRLNAVMRAFLYAKGDLDAYDNALIRLYHAEDNVGFGTSTSILEHMNTPMNALDNFSKGLDMAFPNKYYNGISGTENRTWLFGEFVTAYDPCSCSHPTGLVLQPKFTEITAVELDITGQGTTVPVYSTSEPRSGISAAISGYANTAGVFAKGGKIYKESGQFNEFLEKWLGLSTSSLGTLQAIRTGISVLDLFVNSGKSPTIVSYDSDFSFVAEGSNTDHDLAFPTLFKTPGEHYSWVNSQ
jgi:hypothetical protein